MARKRVHINDECGKRLATIIKSEGETQASLAEKIGLSRKTMSNMVTGKASVTRETAEMVIGLYPNYRIEWLLGFDDVENKAGETNTDNTVLIIATAIQAVMEGKEITITLTVSA